MSGKKGRSGRKKEPTTVIKEALDKLEGDIPQLLASLKERAIEKGDIVALTYLIDRILGKPTQKSELDLSGEIEIAPAMMRQLLETARRHSIESRQALQLPEPSQEGTESRGLEAQES